MRFPMLNGWMIRTRHVGVLLLMMTAGCAPLAYSPGAHPVGMMEASGETVATVRLGTGVPGGSGAGAALQAVHMPVRPLLVYGSVDGAAQQGHQHVFGEAGLGLHAGVGNALTVEVLGGYGRGTFRAYDEDNLFEYVATTTLTGNYDRLAAQANLGVHTAVTPPNGKHAVPAVVGAGLRLARVHGHDLAWDRPAAPEPFRETYAEPMLFVRLGEGTVQFEGQIGASIPTGAARPAFDAQWLYGSLGIRVRVGDLLRD